MKKRPPHPRKATQAQRQQRELAWLLYITEGAKANVNHALDQNGRHLSQDDYRVVHKCIRDLEAATQMLRHQLTQIGVSGESADRLAKSARKHLANPDPTGAWVKSIH